MHFLILRDAGPGPRENQARRTLTGFNAVTYKPASVGARAGWQQAGGLLAPRYLSLLVLLRRDSRAAGFRLLSGAFAVSWILGLVVVGICCVERSAWWGVAMTGSGETRYVQRRIVSWFAWLD